MIIIINKNNNNHHHHQRLECVYIYMYIYICLITTCFFLGGGLLVLHGGATRIRRQLPAALAAKWRDHGDMERIRALNSQKSEKSE